MILGMPAKRLESAVSSPWIAGQIGMATDRLVMVSPDGVNWSTAPTYATGLSVNINGIAAADGLILATALTGTPNVRYSLDGGLTWGTPSGLSITNVRGLTKSGSYWIASGGTTNGIYRSLDGESWTLESSGRTFEEAVAFNGAALVGTTQSLYARSTDDGDTWSLPGIGVSFGTSQYWAVTASRVITASNSSRAFVRISETGLSGSWTSVNFNDGASTSIRSIAASPAGDVLMMDASRNLFYSTDSGLNWSSGGVVGVSGDGVGQVSFGGGAWLIHLFNASFNVAKIFRATAVSGPWTQVAEFASNGAALGGVRYIGP
jgi:hypothetical protein